MLGELQYHYYNSKSKESAENDMATNKRVFTLRLSDEVFDKIGVLASKEHRSMTNYIEFVLMRHLDEVEREYGKVKVDEYGRQD